MKHAWLIIAHNEFKILETLISLLEDPAFDIFIHIDKKVKGIPSFLVPQDRLHIVEPRIDVRWGAPFTDRCRVAPDVSSASTRPI